MSNLPNKKAPPTREQIQRVNDVSSAEEFCKRFYPGLWGRVNEQDLIQLLTIGHALFKTNPEYLEATTNARRLPTQ